MALTGNISVSSRRGARSASTPWRLTRGSRGSYNWVRNKLATWIIKNVLYVTKPTARIELTLFRYSNLSVCYLTLYPIEHTKRALNLPSSPEKRRTISELSRLHSFFLSTHSLTRIRNTISSYPLFSKAQLRKTKKSFFFFRKKHIHKQKYWKDNTEPSWVLKKKKKWQHIWQGSDIKKKKKKREIKRLSTFSECRDSKNKHTQRVE